MDEQIEEFLAGYPPAMQEISRRLRAMVRNAMPEAKEVLFAEQNHVGYSLERGMADRICYICPMKDYVRLGFMFGSHLDDPEGMLQGTGKRLRHVKVRTMQEASNPALQQLVEAAWADAMTQMKK